MANEADVTSYIVHLIETIGKHANIQRDFLLEHMVKHFRNKVPHLNVLITNHTFKSEKQLNESTHRSIEVPWPDSPNGKLVFDLELFKDGVVTFEKDETPENVAYDGKFVKNGNRVEFSSLEPTD